MRGFINASLFYLLLSTSGLHAAENDAATPKAMTVEEVVAATKTSVVVVTINDRNGQQLGLGTGFVISPDGLIATNLHVIGEARPIAVTFADGKKHEVAAVHATDKKMDLAVLRIEAKGLKPIEIGEPELLKEGQPVVAIGNPLGLRHSVVSGVVSAKPEVEGRQMIQVAMPIEKGNSGGPLLDLFGRVQGIITLKSQVKDDLGFAVLSSSLKPLLEKPNPIPMAQWVTIGALDERNWQPLFGARWRQHAGRIIVDEPGRGFGGRSLCLSKQATPELPFEVAVRVKFSPEDGAAGLVFHADGEQKHYGFYPSNGRLRLSRFNGADVYSWKVLADVPHAAYRPGDWNHLRVKVEEGKLSCFINGQLAIESDDTGFKSGAVGIAKFRDTKAEFKQFAVGKSLPYQDGPGDEVVKRIRDAANAVTHNVSGSSDLVQKLSSEDNAATEVLRREAKQLEQRAERLKELAHAVHAQRVQKELGELIGKSPESFDLLKAALLVSKLDNEELDVDGYVREVEGMLDDIKRGLAVDADEKAKLTALNRYLFEQRGFHGSRTNYYSRSNSYLNEVLDDREGLPITLSLLHMEMARRLNLKVVGVGLPGHFVVRFEPAKAEPQLIDVFENGRVMTIDEAKKLISENQRGTPTPEELAAVIEQTLEAATPKAIVLRMLSNLRGVAEKERDVDALRRYIDTILAIDAEHLEARAFRIDLNIRSKRFKDAVSDIDWMLNKKPAGLEVEQVLRLRGQLEAEMKGMM